MPSFHVLTPADCRRMPWRNGGGRTTEIAAFPEGSDLASFAWRVSVADVARDGLFSRFPGVDRTLLLLSGNGMRLTGDGDAIDIRAPFEPVRFAGELDLRCELVDGPVRDFNLMLRRDAARGALAVVRDAPAAVPAGRFTLCFAASGACECLVPDRAPMRLREGDTFVLDGAPSSTALRVNPIDARSAAIVAAIDLA